MVDDKETEQQSRIAYLREAMMRKDYKGVRQLCGEVPEGPLQKISIYEDTVLHMAAHSKQKDFVLDLLDMIPEDRYHELSDIKNADGNTILHELATSNAMKDAASHLYFRVPNLLITPNDLGEKPIFYAARYGQTEMFQDLAIGMKMKKLSPEAHFQRNDETTVLHISITTESFGLALFIAKSYPYLIKERDQSSMTALQYLACNPTAFRRGEIQTRRGFIGLLNKSKIEVQGALVEIFYNIYDGFSTETKSSNRKALRELVRLLVGGETINSQAMSLSESNRKPEIEECSFKLSEKGAGGPNPQSLTNKEKRDESALFLATMSNIQEIIEEVLNYKPEALKRTNKEGMNILHVAILYCHIDIFDMVIKNEMLSRRLLSATDGEGNSVLHMVSQKRKSQASEKMQSPALQLRDELLFFEKVKSVSQHLVTNPLNKDNKTAEELFATANDQLHQEAKEWLMRTTENCTILSVFIATVAFAAIYTVPGGPDQNTGIPILRSKPFFLVFTIADVISLALALTSVGIFLSILTSSFPIQDFKIYLFKKLIQGIICLVLSVSMMAVAFGATIVLMMMSRSGENVVWSVVAFLPVPIFFLSYTPLRSAVLGPCTEWFELFVADFLALGVCLFLYFLCLLVFIIYLVYKGSRWIVKKVCSFVILKPVCWICGIKSMPKSNTNAGSSESTLDLPSQV